MTQAFSNPAENQFLTLTVAGQLYGIPVLRINDVLKTRDITFTPLAPAAVAGTMNLRGRIVTAIDMHSCLNRLSCKVRPPMSVVVEESGEVFSLLVDSVGDVLTLDPGLVEDAPATLPDSWRGVISSVYKLNDRLLITLDIGSLLKRAKNEKMEID